MRPWLALALVLTACGGGGAELDGGADGEGPRDGSMLPTIPADTIPCEDPQYWPLALRSTRHPVLVHYRAPEEEAMAREVMGYLDHAWDVEVGALGFRPPLDDTGHCGDDGALDVWLWRGNEQCYVDVIAENDATPHDDEYSYMVIDPWGRYGGPILDSTVAHELNHAFQAVDDWNDAEVVYEMTAVFVEDQVYDDDDQYVDQIADFQARPDWSLDRDDGYETWFMYGAALYLRFVRDRYFGGDPAFAGDMWRRLRSPYGSGEPDFEDALDAILRARAGVGFLDSTIEFARWRVYTGARAGTAHFEEGASFAEPARAGAVRTSGGQVALSPMTLGSAYVDLTRQAGDPARVEIALTGASTAVTWVVQVVPGAGSDGDRLTLPAVIDVTGDRTLVITTLPRADADPDDRTDARRSATLVVSPR